MPKNRKLSRYLKYGFLIGGSSSLIITLAISLFDKIFLGIPAMIFGVLLCGWEGRGGLIGDCSSSMLEITYILAIIFYTLCGIFIGLIIGLIIWGILKFKENFRWTAQ